MKQEKLAFYGKLVIGGGILLVLTTPYLFTQLHWGISFFQTGQIGDTIGGITAPFVGLIGAILVYFALMAQVNANDLIQKQFDDQKKSDLERRNFANLLELFKQVKEDLEGSDLTVDEGGYQPVGSSRAAHKVPYRGREALVKLVSIILNTYCQAKRDDEVFAPWHEYQSFIQTLGILHLIAKKIETAVLNDVDKETLIALLKHLFESRVVVLIPDKCQTCDADHSVLPEELTELLALIKGTISGLVGNSAAKSES